MSNSQHHNVNTEIGILVKVFYSINFEPKAGNLQLMSNFLKLKPFAIILSFFFFLLPDFWFEVDSLKNSFVLYILHNKSIDLKKW